MSTSSLLTTFHTSVINKLYARSSSSSYAFILKFKLQLVNLFSWTPYNLNLVNNSLELFFFNTKLTPLLWLTQNNPYKVLTSHKLKQDLHRTNLRTKSFLKKFKQFNKMPHTKTSPIFKRSNANIQNRFELFSHNQFLSYRDNLRKSVFPLFNPLVRHRYMRNFLLVEGSYEKRPLFFRKSRRGPSPIRNPLFKFRQMKAKLEYLRKKKERIKKAQIISYVKRNKFRESLFVSIHNKRSIRARRVLQKLKALNLISREQRNLQRLQYLYSRLSSLPLFNIRHKSSSVFKTKFRRIASKLLANYTQELYSKKLTDRIYKLKRQPFFRHQKNSKWIRKIMRKSRKGSHFLSQSSLWLQIQQNTQINSELLLKRSQLHSYRSIGLNYFSFNSLSRQTKKRMFKILLKKQNPKKKNPKNLKKSRFNKNRHPRNIVKHNQQKKAARSITPKFSKNRLTLRALLTLKSLYNSLTKQNRSSAKKLRKSLFNKLRLSNAYNAQKALSYVKLGLFSSHLRSEIHQYVQKRRQYLSPKVRRRLWITQIRRLFFRRKHLRIKNTRGLIRYNLHVYLLQRAKLNSKKSPLNLKAMSNQSSNGTLNRNLYSQHDLGSSKELNSCLKLTKNSKVIHPKDLNQTLLKSGLNLIPQALQTSNSTLPQSPKLFKKPLWFKQVVLSFSTNSNTSDSYSSLYENHPRLLRTAFAKRNKKSSLRVKKQAIPRQHLFLNIREGRLNAGQLKPLKSRLLKLITRRYKRRWKRLNHIKVKSYVRRIRIKKVAKKLLLIHRLRHSKGLNQPRKLQLSSVHVMPTTPVSTLVTHKNYPQINTINSDFKAQDFKQNSMKMSTTRMANQLPKKPYYHTFIQSLRRVQTSTESKTSGDINSKKFTRKAYKTLTKSTIKKNSNLKSNLKSNFKSNFKLWYLIRLFHLYRKQESSMPKIHLQSKFKRFTLRNKHRNVRRRRPLSAKKTKELKLYRANRKKESGKLYLFKKFLPKSFISRFSPLFPSKFKNPVRRKRASKKPLSWLARGAIPLNRDKNASTKPEKHLKRFDCKKLIQSQKKLVLWKLLLRRRYANYNVLVSNLRKTPTPYLKQSTNYFKLMPHKKRSGKSLRTNKNLFRTWQLLWKDCLVNDNSYSFTQISTTQYVTSNEKFTPSSAIKSHWTFLKQTNSSEIELNTTIGSLLKLSQPKNLITSRKLIDNFGSQTFLRAKGLKDFTPSVINSNYFKSKGIQILEADLAINSKYGTKFILSNVGFLYNPLLIQQISKGLRANIIRQKYSFFSMSFVKRTLLKKRGFFKIDKLPVISPHSQNPGHRTASAFSAQSSTLLNFNNLLRQHASPMNTNYKVEPWVKPYRYTHYLAENHNFPVQIRRIRFKPGYSRIWRDARASLNQSLNLNLRYQYRLTVFLNRFARVSSSTHSQLLDLKVIHVLMRSRFAPDVETSTSLLNNNLVFLNGCNTCNPNLLLFQGDVVQLIISLKYYIIYRWLINWNLFKRTRLSKLARAKFKKMHHAQTKQRSFKIPNWVLTSRVKGEDIPKFLEVDFFTLSSFIVYDPFLATDLELSDLLESRFEIYNMYNWKYVN